MKPILGADAGRHIAEFRSCQNTVLILRRLRLKCDAYYFPFTLVNAQIPAITHCARSNAAVG
jgi:hypothetical protein